MIFLLDEKDIDEWDILNIKIMKINKVKNKDENLQLFIYAIYKHEESLIFAGLENMIFHF